MQYEFLPLARKVRNGKLIPIPGFQFWMDLSRPESRGFIKLRSTNAADAPLTVFNHLESRQDMQDMIAGGATCVHPGVQPGEGEAGGAPEASGRAPTLRICSSSRGVKRT
jgi:hypothetical protein